MYNLDIKDKKILFYLLQDSRQSLKTIGKKVGISKELASYRIKRLISNGIIEKFIVTVNDERLGYGLVNIYIKYKNINPNIKQEIIDFFTKSKLTRYVSSLEGIYDLQIQIYYGDPLETESYYDETIKKFHKYISFEFSVSWIRGIEYNYPFLLNEKENKIEPKHFAWGNPLVSIKELDFNILKELAKDSRIPTKKIANKLNSTVSIINYRIKKMISQGVITGYTINVDWLKIGYRWFHLQIGLSDYNKRSEIVKYIQQNPYLIYVMKGLLYMVDIHCTFLLKNVEQLRKIIESITSKFPESIANYQFYSTYKIHKFDYMVPKLLNVKSPANKSKIE
jgi:DNA-binding Lrp family transcriptional regulator